MHARHVTPLLSRTPRNLPGLVVRVAFFLTALGLFVVAARTSDVGAAFRVVFGLGPVVLLVTLPAIAAIALDAVASRASFLRVGLRVPLVRLFVARAATEAIHGSVPLGAIVADSASPSIFARAGAVPVPDAIAVLARRKRVLVRAHGVYVLVASVLGFFALRSLGRTLAGTDALPCVVALSALLPFVASGVFGRLLASRNLAVRIHGLLVRVPWSALRRRLEVALPSFEATDRALAKAFLSESDPRATGSPATGGDALVLDALYLGVWCMETLETFAILRILGVPADLAAVAAFEAGLSIVRSIVIVFPSGLGFSELGYVALFGACGYGGPDVALAFSLVKRGKDLSLVALGFALGAGIDGRSHASRPAGSVPAMPLVIESNPP
ncbi:MAG: hypothetical protein U0169_03060 [Polyangiaceae bacterium]